MASKTTCYRCGKPIINSTKEETGGLCEVCWSLQKVPTDIYPEILDVIREELKRGNKILCVHRLSDSKRCICVQLEFMFKKTHKVKELTVWDSYSDDFNDNIFQYIHVDTEDSVFCLSSLNEYKGDFTTPDAKKSLNRTFLFSLLFFYLPITLIIGLLIWLATYFL